MKNPWPYVLALLVVAIAVYVLIDTVPGSYTSSTTGQQGTNSPVTFYCQQGVVTATFSASSVALKLPDGRNFTLPQVMSGSGIRYEATTTGKDVLFQSKGSSATLSENGIGIYSNCVAAHITNAGGGYHTYLDQSGTFSFTYPDKFVVVGTEASYTTDWMVNATTTGLLLAEVDLPSSALPGTNFSDARFRIGTSADPAAVGSCLTYNPTGGPQVAPAISRINGVSFTKFISRDAAAGNRYDTTSYRTIHDGQCYVVEYTIHYGAIDNYPKGAVTQFDEAKLTTELDAIVASFKFLP